MSTTVLRPLPIQSRTGKARPAPGAPAPSTVDAESSGARLNPGSAPTGDGDFGRMDSALLMRMLRNAIERRQIDTTLARVVLHDTLTSLPNRTLFCDRLDQALLQGERYGRAVALLALDLDGFAALNNRWGHETGNLVLQEVARRLVSCTRQSDTVARIGADEFALILPDVGAGNNAEVVARKLLAAVTAPLTADGYELTVTSSIGISLFPLDAASLDGMIARATAALRHAVAHGRNSYLFSKHMQVL